MTEQPDTPAADTAARQEVEPEPSPSADARELTDDLSHRIWGLPQRAPLLALVELAAHHPALAETCRIQLEKLAGSKSAAERALMIELADTLAQHDPQTAIALVTTALEGDLDDVGDAAAGDSPPYSRTLLLASSQLMNLLLHRAWDSYEQIASIMSRMIGMVAPSEPQPSHAVLAALAERAAGNAVMIACVAACRHPEALDLIRTLDAASMVRKAATATAMAQLVPIAFAPTELLDDLTTLFDDADDEVAKQAGFALYNLPNDNLELVRRLLPAAGAARTFDLASGPVVECLERIGLEAPEIVLQIAERFFDVYGYEAADIRTAAPPDATTLSALIVSTYATHLKEQAIYAKCLDLIDRGILCGTWNIEKHMELLDR